jgi:hypothetical protein
MVDFCAFHARKTLQQMCVAVAVAVGNSFWYQKMRRKRGFRMVVVRGSQSENCPSLDRLNSAVSANFRFRKTSMYYIPFFPEQYLQWQSHFCIVRFALRWAIDWYQKKGSHINYKPRYGQNRILSLSRAIS